MENWNNPLKSYRRITFVNDGIGDIEGNRETARRFARAADWDFDEFPGDPAMFHRLLSGDWDEDSFLVIPPGKTVKPSFTETIINAEAMPS
jgi:hypothetical protein